MLLSDYSRGYSKLVPNFKPVKKVFKCAGEVRNAYIGQKIVSGQQSARKAAKKFRSQKGKHWKHIENTYQRLVTKIKRIKNKSVKGFYETHLRQIADAFVVLLTDDQLHECRTRIKILLFNYKLVRDLLPFRLNTEYLDQLQDMIGKWHDQLLASERIDSEAKTISELNGQRFQIKMNIERLTDNFYQRSTTRESADELVQ